MRFAPDLALSEPWRTPERYWPALSAATAELDPPYAVLDQAALDFNAHDMLRRAGGKPIRVASKSIRVRSVIESLLQLEGYAGVLAYTLPEALWLARTIDDVVVGYPSVHRAAIRTLATDPELAARVTIMVDSVDQLDVVDSVLPPGERESIRVCLELDASWDAPVVGHIGVRRSPVHTAGQAAVMARIIDSRPGFELVGMMSYEAQIAGLANDTPGQRGRSAVIRAIQVRSMRELAERRAEAVAAVRQIAQLWFVNGGGTGSLESTGADDSVTEIAAGSGLFGPHLFDNYRHFSPAPAAAFALSVVRTPAAGMATLMGGGWIASGPPGPDRLPKVVWPEGTAMVGTEMAGEVQTPLSGPGAAGLSAGDRVWLRHTKAGELSEHVNHFALVEDGGITEMLPTYRGEGQDFL